MKTHVRLIALVAASTLALGLAVNSQGRPGAPGAPYDETPAIAPIGARVDKYFDVPESAKGPAIDPAKGIEHRTSAPVCT